jgi:hypothetical protein
VDCWSANGPVFFNLSGLFELTTCSLIVLFVSQGVLLRELTWSRFLLNKGGGNTELSCSDFACYIFKEYTCHIKISERLLLACVMALDYFGIIWCVRKVAVHLGYGT